MLKFFDDDISTKIKDCMQTNLTAHVPEIVAIIGEYSCIHLEIETKECYKYGYYDKDTFIIHRDRDQPAIVYKNGDKEWFKHGKMHRDNNPAGIYAEFIEWWDSDVFVGIQRRKI